MNGNFLTNNNTTGMYHFLYPDNIKDPNIQITYIGIEERSTPSYYFDNTDRQIDSYLFQYTLSGQGILELGNVTCLISKNQGFFIEIPGPSRYYFPRNNSDDPWKFIFILLQGKNVRSYYKKITADVGHVLTLPVHNHAIWTLFDLFQQAKNGRMIHPYYTSEFAYRFLCQLVQTSLYDHSAYSPRTQAAIQIMENDYKNISSIEEIASTLCVSPSYFSREFTNDTNVPPIKYLTNIRLQHALKLLQETRQPVSDIAAYCGFSTSGYFIKLFKKQTGMTPGEFRLM
ncbi:MAG: AraC family transcriptional regulator [Lachnospiraceae bacterium]